MVTNSTPEAFVIHVDREIQYADPALCELLGVSSPDELVGRSVESVIEPEFHETMDAHLSTIEGAGSPAVGCRIELQTATDTLAVIAVTSPIDWQGSQQFQTSFLPIDDGVSRANRWVRDRAMDNAPIGISISDPSKPDNPISYCNDGFTAITGYPRTEVVGRNCRFLQGEATRPEPVAKMREAVAAAEAVTVDLRNYRTDGTMFWNRVSIVPITDESGELTHYLGYQQDITGEKLAEREKTLFKNQAEQSDQAIVAIDLEGRVEYVNPAFERLTGYSAAEMLGRNPDFLRTSHEGDYTELWEQLTAGEVWDGTVTNRTKTGELLELRQKILPITDEYGEITHFVAIQQDITDQELKNQTLDVLNRVLRHNLRTAINVIHGHAELLQSGSDDIDASASVQAILEEAESMQTIADKTAAVRSLWDRSSTAELWDQFDLQAVVGTLQTGYPNADISARVRGEGTVRLRNAELFELAISEAVENAVVHNDQSPAVVDLEMTQHGGHVELTVADNGPGIPETERAAIEAGKETPLRHGMGIGLWMMEWVTTSLGGEFAIEDTEPRGTVLRFRLPNARTSERDDDPSQRQ